MSGCGWVATPFLQADDPEFAETFRRDVLTPRLNLLLRVFQDGVAVGELRPDVDYRRIVDMLVGSYFARFAIDGAVERDWPGSIVTLALPLIAQPPPTDRTGRATRCRSSRAGRADRDQPQ